MKSNLNLWLSQSARLPGVLACGLRYPDQTSFTQPWTEGFEPAALEKSLSCMADVCRLLRVHGMTGQRLRWKYGQGSIFFAQRPDSTCVAIFTTADIPREAREQLRLLLDHFIHDENSADQTPVEAEAAPPVPN